MKTLLKIASFSGLALMLGSAIAVFYGVMTTHVYYIMAAVGTGLWFASVPFWMRHRLHKHSGAGAASPPETKRVTPG